MGRRVYDLSDGRGDTDFGHECFVLPHRPVTLGPTGVVASPFITHLQYRIVK